MSRSRKALLVFLFIVSLISVGQARAESFAKPSLDSIMKVLVRYGSVDIRSDAVMDLYGSIMVCDLYSEFYRDDFKWNDIRHVLRKSIQEDVAFFPIGFKYDAVLQLGKYDFNEKIYRFSRNSAQFKANVFNMNTNSGDDCNKKEGLLLPSSFQIILDKPVQIIGLPMNEEDGKKIFSRMDKNNNLDHLIYVRFNINVTYVAPFLDKTDRAGVSASEDFRRGKEEVIKGTGKVRIDGMLQSIEYFEDEAYMRLLYKEDF